MSHQPHYQPSSMRKSRRNEGHNVIVIVLITLGSLGTASLMCCGLASRVIVGLKSPHDAAIEERRESGSESQQWHDQLITHLKEGRRDEASRMFPEAFQTPGPKAENLGLMLDVLTVATTQQHGLVKLDTTTEVIDGEEVEKRSSYVHVASRKAHDYDVGVVIDLERDASGALQVKEYTVSILSMGKNDKVVTNWGESFSSIEAMGGFKGIEDALAQRVRPMKRKSACVEYFAPYTATFEAHPKPLEIDRKNIAPVIDQMCETISEELGRKGIEQVGVSVTLGSTKGMEGLIRDWVSGHIVGLPVSIKYKYARGGQTRTLEIFASSTVDLRHPGKERSWTIDGYRLDVEAERGSEAIEFNVRDVFRSYSVPYALAP